MNRWLEMLSRLGQGVVELLTAECSALVEELKVSGRRLGTLIGVLVLAAGLGLGGLALVALALVSYLSLLMQAWLAAVAVAAGLLAIATLLGLWACRRIARLEGPGKIVRRRWESQEEFWRKRVLGPGDDDRERP